MRKASTTRSIPALLFLLGMVLLATLMPQTAWAADDWTYPTGEIKNPFGGGKGTKDDPYIISTAQHLANLAHMVNYKDKDYDGEYFLMTRDIVLNDNVLDPSLTKADHGVIRYSSNKEHFDKLKKWAPIGNYGFWWNSHFGGVFDGGGHTISGLYINEGFRNGKISDDQDENTYHGLFGLCWSARISNLTIKDSYMTTWHPGSEYTCYYGMLVGRDNNSTITNCHVVNCMIAGNPDKNTGSMYAGGMVGYFNGGNMSGCSCNATVEVYQKKNIATVESESDYYAYVFAGGLVGYITNKNTGSSTLSDCLMTDCHTSGSVVFNATEIESGRGNDHAYVGGLIGFVYRYDKRYAPEQLLTMARRCTNSMNIYAFDDGKDTEMEAHISGLVNSLDKTVLTSTWTDNVNTAMLEDCANFGNIYYGRFNPSNRMESSTAKHYLAGLGCWMAFKRCVNYGDIHIAHFTNGDNMYVSGMLSEASNDKDKKDKLINCLNCGSISYDFSGNAPHVDPIAAVNIGQSYVNGCYHNVTVNDDKSYLDSYFTDGAKKLDDPKMFQDIDLARELNLAIGSVQFGTVQDATSERNGYVLPISLGATINDISGKGTVDEPYLVYNLNDLQCMADRTASAEDMKGKVFRLEANLDLSGSENLPEIGSESRPFVSTFDGNGHYIRGMKGYQGAMFNYLGEGAEIKNLALLDAQPTEGEFYGIANYVGGHDVTGASIHDCYVTADIDCEDHDLTIGGICNFLYTDNKVENCYFSGNVKMVNNSNAIARIAGIVHTNFGTVLNCHAVLSYQDAGTQKTRDHVGAFNNAAGTQFNCYMALLLSGSKWDVEDKMTTGATMYENEGDIKYTALGSDAWLNGLYHPVLKNAYHYTGNTNIGAVGIDPDPVKHTLQHNLIVTVDPTADQTTDTRLWQLTNVAVCSDVYKAYILSDFTLSPDAEINCVDHHGYPLIGSAAYKLTAQQGDNWYSLCLPGIVKQRSLPDGAKLYVGGTLSNNRMNIVEVDSVPAGVPFLMYCNASEAGDFYIHTATMSQLMTSSVKAADNSSLQGTFRRLNTLDIRNMCCSKVTVGTDGKLYLTQEPDGYVSSYTAYVDNTAGSGADVELTQYLLLDENDNMTDKSVETNNERSIGIKLMRNIQTSGWNTLCLPFDVTTTELKERLGNLTKIEMLSDVTYDDASTSVVLHFSSPTDDVVKAGTPFLLYAENLGTLFDFSARTIVNEVHPAAFNNVGIGSDGTANITLTGSFGKRLLASTDEENIYFVQLTTLYQAGSRNSVTMRGFRCWISVTDATGTKAQTLRSARLVHADGTATDIRLVDMGTADDGSHIYDLQGIQHDTMQRGVNITRGKKVVRK